MSGMFFVLTLTGQKLVQLMSGRIYFLRRIFFHACLCSSSLILQTKNYYLGTIVNHPQKQVAYNTSKAAVVHMTKTLGAEWAERGVTVNCISPYNDINIM